MSLKSIKRKDRQKSNLGGIIKLVLFSASDFTADWPKETDITAGEITGTTIPLAVGKTGAVLTFDLGTCRIKASRKGKIGYQNCDHEGECKFAGYDSAQIDAINTTFNEGGVGIATYKDGTRVVVGTSYEPLSFEVSSDSGAKSDDNLTIDFKFKTENSVAFMPPTLATTVTVPLPA